MSNLRPKNRKIFYKKTEILTKSADLRKSAEVLPSAKANLSATDFSSTGQLPMFKYTSILSWRWCILNIMGGV